MKKSRIAKVLLMACIFTSVGIGSQLSSLSINSTPQELLTSMAPQKVYAETLSNSTTNNNPINSTSSNAENSTNTQNNISTSAIEQAIFNQVNEERAKLGLSLLTNNSTMQKYAIMKSQDMATNNYFNHANKDGSYMNDIMKRDGVTYKSWGENIAYISDSNKNSHDIANSFMTNWMNSPGHKANILSKDFTGIGVGVYKVGNKYYATQEFFA